MKTLTGAALAKEYARTHPLSEQNPGKVWASYEGGGWIELRGEGLRSHPDLAHIYKNGWSLLHRVRSSAARAEIKNNHKRLRKTYAEAGCS
jgi:hypothetical protein